MTPITITITEALAELKTIGKRLEKKRASVLEAVARPDSLRDPYEKIGGSVALVKDERQAIRDLEQRTISIRAAIADANRREMISVGTETRSIADWLCWRRDVVPTQQVFVVALANRIRQLRAQAQQQMRVTQTDAKPSDVAVNLDEAALVAEIESIEQVLGALDGQLSLKNATVTINI